MRWLPILVSLAMLLVPLPGRAHEVRPAYLDLSEERPGEFNVLWKTPMLGEMRLALDPVFSGRVEALTPVAAQMTGDAAVQTWRVRAENLRGQTLRIDGLETTLTDVLVRVAFTDGSTWVHRLTPRQPASLIPARPNAWSVAGTYLALGVEHILTGIDHLLFVLALLAPGHQVYPYLLRKLPITRPNQVWAMDITYIPMARGFVYLAAVIDWFSRRVLAWRLSITLEAAFCIEAVEEAIARYGCPEIFNTDQGSQFTSHDFTSVLLKNEIAISMDGKGAWRDNVFVERLWRSIKYEEVYLKAYDSVAEARASIGRYLTFYNGQRPHSSLDRRTPDQAYFNPLPQLAAA
jgi:transposase InsO family protein